MPNRVTINDSSEAELFTASNPGQANANVQVGGTDVSVSNPVPVDVVHESLTHVCSTVAVTGPTAVIAAPGAGQRLVVSSFVVQNESATATTIILQAGASDVWRVLAQNQGDGLSAIFPVGREWKLPANTALNIELSGANSCGYSIAYYTEDA